MVCLLVSTELCLVRGYGSGDLAKSFWSGLVVWAASSDGLGYLGETGILQLWHVACFCPNGCPQYGHVLMLAPPESVHAGQMPSGSPKTIATVHMGVKLFLRSRPGEQKPP
jgi:hypothetical protein